MALKGEIFSPSEPRSARASGVAMVFQHFSLFEALSVGENIALGMENPPKSGALSQKIATVSNAYGLPLDPQRLVGDLSAGERQRVEIIRCLLQDPKLLIMDEPTSVLTPQEVFTLFTTLRKLKSEGTSILYISHKLEEIRELCETASILRGGKKVATCDPREKSARELAEMMVGGTINSAKASSTEIGETILKVSELSLPPQSAFGKSLKSISLNLHKGEVLGIGGVAGNGQDELLACLSGEAKTTGDAIQLNGVSLGHMPPNTRRALGVLAAPEERLGHAAAPDMTLTENAMLTAMTRKNLSHSGFLDWPRAEAYAKLVIINLMCGRPGHAVSRAVTYRAATLQKFVIGREVLQDPDVFIVNQPTWGVDAAAAASIRQALLDLTAKGAAVVVISQDLDELMEISTRFAVLNNGKLSEAQPMADLSLDEIGLLLGGADAAA